MSFPPDGARRAACVLAVAALSIAGMGMAAAQNLTVFAAASLKNALDEIDAGYRARSGVKSIVSYAASSALARQIESGAPADIFVSADLEWMDYLEKRGLLKSGTRTNLLRNEIVLIVPADFAGSFSMDAHFPLAKLLGNGRLAMADPDHVPAGKYGKAALEALKIWPSVSGRIARTENVRAALLFVARGEAPAGIVYRTDAIADRKVRIAGTFPAGSHPSIVYPAALLAGGKGPGAQKFLELLKSPAAATVFERHGFLRF